jgi:aminopeptidase N
MVKKALLLILLTTTNLLQVHTQINNNPSRTFYRLDIRFSPDSGFITGRAEIQNPRDSGFLLSKSLKIQSVSADGKPVRFHLTPTGSPSESCRIITPVIPSRLVIVYSGRIKPEDYPKTISSINMVNHELVELSDHIAWYPRMVSSSSFEYLFNADFPSEYVTLTNGQFVSGEIINDRCVTAWKSNNLTSGITLLAAPGLKKTTSHINGITLEIYYDRLPGTYVDSMKTDLHRSLRLLSDLFGSTIPDKLIRIVYSPRSAGGYCRSPLIIVSENYALEQRATKYGYARDFRLNTHELAHYWSAADVNSPDDWINEGLAEYSALLISEKVIGRDFSDVLLSEYRGIVQNSHTQTAIVETYGDSWEREINRYYKPTLLLNDIREKYGEEKLNQFLKTLITRFVVSQNATTEIFLDALEASIDKNAKNSFDEALHRKVWTPEAAEGEDVPVDAILAGTWNGLLTQFGSSARFVLKISSKDGKLVATLDSPDQNVLDIPVYDFIFSNDIISFKVAVASASYSGRLDRNKFMITGTWTQRGTDYPLTVARENQ